MTCRFIGKRKENNNKRGKFTFPFWENCEENSMVKLEMVMDERYENGDEW